MGQETEIKEFLESVLEVVAPASATKPDNMKQWLTERFNHLINTDFSRLIQILYRVDIDEKKLESILKENENKNTGEILADLTIERQLQKIRSRQQYKRDENISDDEKW